MAHRRGRMEAAAIASRPKYITARRTRGLAEEGERSVRVFTVQYSNSTRRKRIWMMTAMAVTRRRTVEMAAAYPNRVYTKALR